MILLECKEYEGGLHNNCKCNPGLDNVGEIVSHKTANRLIFSRSEYLSFYPFFVLVWSPSDISYQSSWHYFWYANNAAIRDMWQNICLSVIKRAYDNYVTEPHHEVLFGFAGMKCLFQIYKSWAPQLRSCNMTIFV